MELNVRFWRNRRIFLTGHTGFKGSWLALLLHELGAKVYGYALDPMTTPSLFDVAEVSSALAADTRADIRDRVKLEAAMQAAAPDIVLHLAAQPLVLQSYAAPLETYEINVMGTAYLLETVRRISGVRAVVVVTTDKCYENDELSVPFRETDPMGGRDPYSSSKACAEIITGAYRQSYFEVATQRRVSIATARAGNVIGGGDWAADRLIPDCIRAFASNQPVRLRYPGAIRPWQHVLEPVVGYLMLAERLAGESAAAYCGAWNFGPAVDEAATVGSVVAEVAKLWGDCARVDMAPASGHEAGSLRLNIDKAKCDLGWRPVWPLERTLGATVEWYRAWIAGQNMPDLSRAQIAAYLCEAAAP